MWSGMCVSELGRHSLSGPEVHYLLLVREILSAEQAKASAGRYFLSGQGGTTFASVRLTGVVVESASPTEHGLVLSIDDGTGVIRVKVLHDALDGRESDALGLLGSTVECLGRLTGTTPEEKCVLAYSIDIKDDPMYDCLRALEIADLYRTHYSPEHYHARTAAVLQNAQNKIAEIENSVPFHGKLPETPDSGYKKRKYDQQSSNSPGGFPNAIGKPREAPNSDLKRRKTDTVNVSGSQAAGQRPGEMVTKNANIPVAEISRQQQLRRQQALEQKRKWLEKQQQKQMEDAKNKEESEKAQDREPENVEKSEKKKNGASREELQARHNDMQGGEGTFKKPEFSYVPAHDTNSQQQTVAPSTNERAFHHSKSSNQDDPLHIPGIPSIPHIPQPPAGLSPPHPSLPTEQPIDVEPPPPLTSTHNPIKEVQEQASVHDRFVQPPPQTTNPTVLNVLQDQETHTSNIIPVIINNHAHTHRNTIPDENGMTVVPTPPAMGGNMHPSTAHTPNLEFTLITTPENRTTAAEFPPRPPQQQNSQKQTPRIHDSQPIASITTPPPQPEQHAHPNASATMSGTPPNMDDDSSGMFENVMEDDGTYDPFSPAELVSYPSNSQLLDQALQPSQDTRPLSALAQSIEDFLRNTPAGVELEFEKIPTEMRCSREEAQQALAELLEHGHAYENGGLYFAV